MLFRSHDLDATYSVEEEAGRVSVILEARGGTAGGDEARNTAYRDGLTVLLERLGRAGRVIADAQVDSARTRDLTADERRIPMDAYPLRITDAAALAKALMRAQATVGREPGARGSGNSTRRIRLILEGVAEGMVVARELEG